MIKVNLLNSVTDRAQATGVAAVERKVADPRTQMGVIAAACAVVMLVVMGFDYVTANAAQGRAEAELAEQKRVQEQMAAIIKEQKDLEKQTKDINARIAAIQSLRSTQKGPVAVLSAINERIPQMDNFRLDGVEQKGGNLVITGDSPNEAAVTQFGRSLEFSSGLFSNVSIEIQRKAMEGIVSEPSLDPTQPSRPPSETVSFTIKCSYTPPAPTAPTTATAATPVAPPAAPAPVVQ